MKLLLESNLSWAFFRIQLRRRAAAIAILLAALVTGSGWAAPVIDPIGSVTIPAGKSLILPVTATSPSGLPLTYTVASSTNRIGVILHTNNPFWQLSVAQAAATNAPGAYLTPFRNGMVMVTNLGNLTFMLFPEYAPHAVNVFQGLTMSGFFNSNTIFHRVVTNALIQGGDPFTNGLGGLVVTYADEYNPMAMFSGNGQLALANAEKNANGSQFFITKGAQRSLDFNYPLFGQLLRGFEVLTNVADTGLDTNDAPLAQVIIQQAVCTNDTTDTVLTLTATNRAGINGLITLIAADSAGGRATNTFSATIVADTNSDNQAMFYPNSVTNLVGRKNVTLTNMITAVELDNDKLYWYPAFADSASANAAPNSEDYGFNTVYKTMTYNVKNTNGGLGLLLVPTTNYVGPVTVYFDVSYGDNSEWWLYKEFGISLPDYAEKVYTFVFGDTPISGQSNVVAALASVPFTNVLLATFANGVSNSTAANFSAFINWGDDTTNSGMVTANAAGKKAVLGSHTYAYPGNYPVYVEVQSTIGARDTILSFVNVTNPSTPATNLFTVLTSGPGTVSPAYTNTPLAVGASYSLSATPASDYFLLNWTDNHGFILGTSTNLTFTMSPGLTVTANFIPITAPGLAFASPTPGQVLTNLYSATVTVSGVASNTAGISAVWYQVNSGGWQTASGTTSWTAGFMPEYGGTNVIQAYAVNIFGYISPTNTLWVKYLAGGILHLETNGLGSITPNLNGQLLPLGTNYSLAAAPAAGFLFTNWSVFTNSVVTTNSSSVLTTNWLGGVATVGRTLQFTMQTNLMLSANFVDTNPPTLSITNLVAGQRISNAVFTVKGKASDNWQVATVNVRLNSGSWTNAAGTTIWSSPLRPVPGTNTVQAYAVDNSGNVSPTASVSFIYVPSATLSVTVVGQGTLTPNYNGALLALSNNYTMQAKAINGFAFSHWTEGTFMTTNTSLTFTMATNLSLTATFVDVTIPVVTITNPAANQKWSNSVITAKGKASDNAGVAEVWCRINNGSWTAAQTSNNFTNWTATNLPVRFGTNILQAYALDAAVNVSMTNAVKFLGGVAPTSLAGYQGTLTPSTGKQQKIVTWGDTNWSQTGSDNDTNADNYCAGSYAYFLTGPNTAVVSNMDIGMLSALRTTNFTTVHLTFSGSGTASCTWTNESSSGAGTMTFSTVTELVPASLAGMTLNVYTNGVLAVTDTLVNDGSFSETGAGGGTSGTYMLTQYSPTSAILELDYTSGGVTYAQLTFNATGGGEIFVSHYSAANQAYGSNPNRANLGTFILTQ